MTLIEEKTLADHDINVKSIRQELQLLEEQLKKHGRNEIQLSLIATDSDTVSRKQVIDEIEERKNANGYRNVAVINELNRLEGYIMRLPSAQPDSKELSFTHKALDTISRQAAIRWVKTECNPYGKPTLDFESGKKVIEHLEQMPSIQPKPCGDVVSRNAIVKKLNEMDRYVSAELRLCDTDKKFPQNEVFIVDDVYEEIVEQLPSVHPDIEEDEDIPMEYFENGGK